MTSPAPTRSHAFAPRPSLRRRGRAILASIVGVLIVLGALAGIGLGVAHSDRSELLGRLDPALQRSGDLVSDLINEEAAVRGLLAAGGPPSPLGPLLEAPYQDAIAQQIADRRQLGRLLAGEGNLTPILTQVDRDISRWRQYSVDPVLRGNVANEGGALAANAQLFANISSDMNQLNDGITDLRQSASQRFSEAYWVILGVTILVFGTMVVLISIMALTLRRLIIRPLISVAGDSRRVAAGDFDHPVAELGPAEIADLANDIEAMRSRIVQDLRALGASQSELRSRSDELARSNRDLEQFAYVASHDLQEPLRKVASFCQLLSQRYRDSLDERGLQYIDFAVDGAKRMQSLVNDLLQFSRVGRTTAQFVPVDIAEAVATAKANLERRITETGTEVNVQGELPTVPGDQALLAALFQNLISNSIKFRSDAPPVVTISAERRAPARAAGSGVMEWEISVSDNGIGIEPRFAERVFIIFQRLHTRDRYEGTGIGLAMCRKIVEFHGGDIWLDTEGGGPGTTIRFTLGDPPDPENENRASSARAALPSAPMPPRATTDA